MAANSVVGPVREEYHVYHAEAHVLSGHIEHPVKRSIEDYGRITLEKTRREGHFTESVGETSIEGLITFKKGYTSVSGTQLKNKKDMWGKLHSGWVTLSTSVLEGLNVFEVVTADRMVAQVSTSHAAVDGHVPKVTFLGTRFENLRVGGYPVEVELDLGFCGGRPADGRTYLQDIAFLDRVQRQLDGVADAKDLPEKLAEQYQARITYIDDLKKRAKQKLNDDKLTCSLVKSIGRIPIPGVQTFGNVIVIPDFGSVALAEVEVGTDTSRDPFTDRRSGSTSEPSDGTYFALNMVNMYLGCIGGAKVTGGGVKANGQSYP
jgi:hypothetical protein